MKTLTVAELIERLQCRSPKDKVYVWLPGSRIAISSVGARPGFTFIEGNVVEGSAITVDLVGIGRSPAEREQDRLDFEAMMDISQHGGKP